MEYPSKRRKIERSMRGSVEGYNLNGRERSISLGGSSKNEKPIVPKLVLPPHGAPGHPAHGNQTTDDSSQGVDRPHYPLDFADTRPSRVHARQIVQPSVTDAAPIEHKTSEARPPPRGSPTSEADDNSYPGQVVPPAAVAAANARNQALESQQAQAQAQAQGNHEDVAVKQLDAILPAPAPTAATHAAASASPQPMQVPDSLSQQVVKVPSTPPPSNPSPTPESSASYFPASPESSSSISPSPQHISTPPAPSPTFTPNKHESATNHNTTMSCKLVFDLCQLPLY